MDDFIKVMTNQQPSIRARINRETEKQIGTANRQKLHSIIEIVLFCGKQNIPLRGHRDSLLDVELTPSAQHGNFWALLQFRVEAGDAVLKKHLAHSSKNATYTSSVIQKSDFRHTW